VWLVLEQMKRGVLPLAVDHSPATTVSTLYNSSLSEEESLPPPRRRPRPRRFTVLSIRNRFVADDSDLDDATEDLLRVPPLSTTATASSPILPFCFETVKQPLRVTLLRGQADDDDKGDDMESGGNSSGDLDASSTHSDRSLKPADLLLAAATTTTLSSPSKWPIAPTRATMQLAVGILGIYTTFLYHGHVQEDLYRYRSPSSGQGYALVWSHLALESALSVVLGWVGRRWFAPRTSSSGGTNNNSSNNSSGIATKLPLAPFVQMGLAQLAAKTLTSKALEVGVSYPILTVAKSAKLVPVMVGQLVLGGSSYKRRDYCFAILIVAGTALLSAGHYETNPHYADLPLDDATGQDTAMGLGLIVLSLAADGLTGGIQKRLQRTAAPTTYDFLYFAHWTQAVVAGAMSVVMGEVWTVPDYLTRHATVAWLVLASCASFALGQCFVCYTISCFDPLICTTITTSRKMLTVLLSIGFKGHSLTGAGCVGLGLACLALLVEVQGKVVAWYRSNLPRWTKGANMV
jgi:solute carrier family 35 (UDP-galactose transporter), member B1